jgi:hypothetical protein
MSRALALMLTLGTVLVAVGLACGPLMTHAGAAAWRPGTALGGRLAVVDGLALLELSGPPELRGRQAAALVGHQGADLLAVMRWNPREPLANQPRRAAVLAATRAGDRAEIDAFAAATGLDAEAVLRANATIETLCSAVVHLPSARVARNMDFMPAGPLGQATLVQVVREAGRHSYAAVGWPAMSGVISGLNDAGLSACILLNWKAGQPPPGEPLAFRVRAILQDCADVAAGLAAMAASPVGSRHYVLLADGRDAAVAWWAPDGLHVDRPGADGWLVASNGPRDGATPVAGDRRGDHLGRRCAALQAAPDPAWFRRVVSASYMPWLNAQAMVFDLRPRHLELAVAKGTRPAALRPWHVIELGPVLDGAPVDQAVVRRLPAERPMPHYVLGER